jgi:LacI family transcriptional regulator
MSDVAQKAGVSLMTVSRVVNNKGEISAKTIERVQKIIEELGYRPSSIARSLASGQTRTIGLIVPDVANPFFADVTRGVEHLAYSQGYNVFLCNAEEDPQRELSAIQSLEEKQVDGVILCSSRLEDNQLQEVLGRQPAAVLINRRIANDRGNHPIESVILDDAASGQLATWHLLDRGHRRIGFLAGPKASFSGQNRTKGFRAALQEAGVAYHPEWVRHCLPYVESGFHVAIELLNEHPDLTALLCYNDLTAIGVLQACAETGRLVPDDLAVVGHDDIALASLVTPALTTCRVSRYELGGQAVKALLKRINEHPQNCTEIVLQPELVVRASAP